MVEKYSQKYPAIGNLLCCYFHQDWEDNYDTFDAVIQDFATSNGRNWLKKTVVEFKTLLQEEHTKHEWLCIIHDNFGCCYALQSQGIEPIDWLKRVQKQLEEELALAEENEKK